jgi:hypothetical protein
MSRAAKHREQLRARSCTGKRKFVSADEALSPKAKAHVYECSFCGYWHRSQSTWKLEQQLFPEASTARNPPA